MWSLEEIVGLLDNSEAETRSIGRSMHKQASTIAVSYDREVDCGYVYFREIGHGEVRRTIPVHISPEGLAGELNIDVDADGRVVGIEVMKASSIMPQGFFGRLAPT